MLFQTCINVSLLLNIEDILKNVGNQLLVSTYLYSIVTQKMEPWKPMPTSNCLVPNIFLNIFFCVHQKKETERVNDDMI